ncbi:glycoside hydrolase family 5 protein [Microbacterium sp. YJN-G]|uniref:glycoside hydrolase family 5 protein n=1 Tax=Microbacterium sp. YJN-G TaxID=2763257 RepID=UPI0018779B1C|nr:cellulase family glycosylhydrolase [Microbacterium sp. YJN-G]
MTIDLSRRTLLMGVGAIVTTSVLGDIAGPLPAAVAAGPVTWTDVVGRFESRHEPWTVSYGPEYGTAGGGFVRDEERAAEGTFSGRLTADFTSAGRYVALVKTLDHLEIQKVRFKVTGRNITRVAVRLVSGTRVLRQAYAAVPPGPGAWIGIEMDRWNNIVGFPDAVTLQIQVWKDHLALATDPTGDLWVDDVQIDHLVQEQKPATLETSGLPVLLLGDADPVPLSVRATYSDRDPRDVTQHSALSSSNTAVITIDKYGALKPVAAGRAEIRIEHLGVSQTFPVEVRAPRDLAPITIRDGKFHDGDAPFGFTGFNYDLFLLSYPRRALWSGLDADVSLMASWGLAAIRVPLAIGLVQPANGVFPDDDAWAGELRKRGLNTEFIKMLDHFVARAGEHGIRVILDWHRSPTDPYDYWQGGTPSDRGTGKPGTAVSYLAPSPTESGELDLTDAEHRTVLFDSHRWIAGHYKGNPNVLGIEVPHNEPHAAYMSIQSNWRRLTEQASLAVKAGDPGRLTLAMPPAYGHDVSTAAPTWQFSNIVDANAPHHYLPNAPIPARDDASSRRSPWLARDIDAVFAYAIPALFAPYSTSKHPVYNGEGGHYGFESFLPDMDRVEAADYMTEAGLVQYYAAGAAGQLHWSLWHNLNDFVPFEELFDKHYRRFSPVYSAGPVDWSGAEVAFIQNPAAVPAANGHNFAVVPFVRRALDLHLPTWHLLTDDEIIETMLTQVPSGLEQVEGLAASFDYKAVVADRRNLDRRVRQVLERDDFDRPILWLDDAEDLTVDALGAFLRRAGVAEDRRTSAHLQLVYGPQHLVVYRRGGADGRERVFPRVRRDGAFSLVDESGEKVYQGDAATLSTRGISVDLPTWRSLILRIE